MMGGPRQKERYIEEGGNYRWLKSKDVAQALVAFLGFPGEAKDKIRFFFEGTPSSEFGDLSYKNVYVPGLSAMQLLFPALIHRRITARVDQDKSNVELIGTLDWLDYARLHLVWLVGEVLRNTYQLPRIPFPRERAQSLVETIGDWFDPLYQVARACTANAVSQARQDQYRGHREFFRNAANYRSISEKLPLALEFARQSGIDPLSRLPSA
jgi:hypothetical protein